MKHATKQEANAARLAALKASREKRTYAKHERWAQEMRAAGYWVVLNRIEHGAELEEIYGDIRGMEDTINGEWGSAVTGPDRSTSDAFAKLAGIKDGV